MIVVKAVGPMISEVPMGTTRSRGLGGPTLPASFRRHRLGEASIQTQRAVGARQAIRSQHLPRSYWGFLVLGASMSNARLGQS